MSTCHFINKHLFKPILAVLLHQSYNHEKTLDFKTKPWPTLDVGAPYTLLITIKQPSLKLKTWRHDIQHNDTQNNDIQDTDIQHKGLICGT